MAKVMNLGAHCSECIHIRIVLIMVIRRIF